MNIWIFNQYAHPPDLPGGTRHYDLGRELVRRGHQVVIFATSFHHHLRRETRLKPGEYWKIENVNGVNFIWLRTPPYQRNDKWRMWNMTVFMFRAWWLGRKIPDLVPEIGKPDVIIGSSPPLLTPLAAYWIAKHYRIKFVMEVRDLWPQTIIDMGGLSVHHPITKTLQFLERFLYRRAERIITLLPFAHEYITACGFPQEKIVWIPNGVDLSRFEDFVAAASPKSEKVFKVMYLGAHGQANALDVLIQTAKVIQDRGYSGIRFILVGDGPEKPKLMALAKDLGLHNVEFREPVPKSEVTKVLQEADVFLLNLEKVEVFRYGISPNKLFDYMAAGKPIISSVRTLSSPVEVTRCGLVVPPRDPKALVEAVITLYRMSPKERAEMGRRGREYVAKYHDIRKLALRLEEVLISLQ